MRHMEQVSEGKLKVRSAEILWGALASRTVQLRQRLPHSANSPTSVALGGGASFVISHTLASHRKALVLNLGSIEP